MMEDDERPRVTGNSAPSFKTKYQYPLEIHKLRCFPENETGKCCFHFPPS